MILLGAWFVGLFWHLLGGITDIIHLFLLARAGSLQIFTCFVWAVSNHSDKLMVLLIIGLQVGTIWWFVQYFRVLFCEHVEW
jgi:hypothetical protein